MSEEQTQYPTEPSANVATDGGMNGDPQPDAPIVAQETATLGEEAAQTAEAEQQAAQGIETEQQVAPDPPHPEGEIVSELEAAVAAKDAEIADLKSKLAETEQRAALPPLAGNPAPSTAPAPLSGYDLIRKAVEGVQLGFDFK